MIYPETSSMLVGDEIQLNVGFPDSEMARNMGCWYDSFCHSWFCSPNNAKAIAKFKDPAPKTYYKVPFARKDEAKAAKMRWDADRRLWYYQAYTPMQGAVDFESLDELDARNKKEIRSLNKDEREKE
jgi:hypothetical protein